MNNVKLIVLFIATAFIINGCAGVSFSWKDASTVKIGDGSAEVI